MALAQDVLCQLIYTQLLLSLSVWMQPLIHSEYEVFPWDRPIIKWLQIARSWTDCMELMGFVPPSTFLWYKSQLCPQTAIISFFQLYLSLSATSQTALFSPAMTWALVMRKRQVKWVNGSGTWDKVWNHKIKSAFYLPFEVARLSAVAEAEPNRTRRTY